MCAFITTRINRISAKSGSEFPRSEKGFSHVKTSLGGIKNSEGKAFRALLDDLKRGIDSVNRNVAAVGFSLFIAFPKPRRDKRKLFTASVNPPASSQKERLRKARVTKRKNQMPVNIRLLPLSLSQSFALH